MVYSSGVYVVKEGREQDFVRTWEANTALVPGEHPGVVFRLLRDADDPRRFVSVVGPWKNREELDGVRSTPEFQQGLDRARELTESIDVLTYETVAEVS